MTSAPPLAPRRRLATVARPFLLVMVTNEEHVLAALDSVTGDAPLPDSPATVPAGVVVGPGILAAGARLSAPVARGADSRAPPLA